MSPKPFVLFDLGETLVDLKELLGSLAREIGARFPAIAAAPGDLARQWIVQASQEMPREEGHPFVSEFEISSQVLAELLSERGVMIEPSEAGRILRAAWDDFEPRVRFCEGVSEAWLRDLRSLSAGMGIVTDGDAENVGRLRKRLPLDPYFDVVITSEAVRAYKPNPRIYRAALETLHAEPDRTLFVSDSPLDLQGAAALGLRPVFMGGPLIHGPRGLPPGTLRVSKPQELPGILRRFERTGRFEEAERG